MKIEHFIFGICLICGTSLQTTTSRRAKLDDYVNKKLQSIARWLHSRKDATIFDYIYNVNYGLGLNLYQGDIKGYNPRHRTAVRDQTYLWNTRVVPYVFDPTFDSEARQDVMQAISEYHSNTCIRFVPKTNQKDYIIFKHISGCYSNVGRQGGEQELSLMKPCLKMGTAIHELMHALGFWHEQSRPDRDSWIQVLLDNIEKGKTFNFDKLSVDEVDTLGVQYDYGSIMHYSKYSFSKNGNPTILPIRNTNAEIGQRDGLSPLDIKRINTLYRCDIPNPNQNPATTSRPTTPQQTPPLPTTKLTPPAPTKPTTKLTTPVQTKPTTPVITPPVPTTSRRTPTAGPAHKPTSPTAHQQTPTLQPTLKPTQKPTLPTATQPTQKPTLSPTGKPTLSPTKKPLPPTARPPIGWSSWSFFTPCDLQCRRQRYRFCLNMDSKYCAGSSIEKDICGTPCKPASYLGCWKTNLSNLTIPSVEGRYPTLTDKYQGRTGAVRKCADVASVLGNMIFAMYNYGMCLTGPNAVSTFSQYGASSDCGRRGKGGSTGISVYSFQKDIDGQWGIWTEWGQCTRTCGGGEQYRYRQCKNPPPIGNGSQCKDSARESRTCNDDKCSADAKCGLKYYMGEPGTSGIIHLLDYDNYMNCDYKIETGNANTTISLAITRIDIEYSRGCFYDMLSIYDGPDKYSNQLGDFCGNQPPVPFESAGNALFISFQSDSTTTAGGYTIEYTVNSRTRKSCTELQQPAHSLMIGTSNFAGDRIVFVCDPGYRMQGNSQLTCVDQSGFALWSDSTPFCIRNFKRSAYMPFYSLCDFDGNLCGFENNRTNDLDWQVVRNENMENKIEYYLKTSSAKSHLPGDSGRLRSKPYIGGGDVCLQFSYKLTGNDDTKLNLYMKDVNNESDTLIWTGTADEIEVWKTHKTILYINNPFHIVFEYIVGETVYSAAELDNILVKNGMC